ncbi:MAG: DUF4935 domain-containing protein [Chitinophagales bacterium]|nr:DUF4935 domain-containing protein [Chitinophagales bacterium]
MNYIYIDANVYLKFYLGDKLFKVLETLVDNLDSVIVTRQIADEVLRNSVSVNAANLKNALNSLQWHKPSLPYKNASAQTVQQITTVYNQFKALKLQIESDLEQQLLLISKQGDEITTKLNEIFSVALQPTADEIENAKLVKTFGNPPGKKSDPIGDELSWLQLLNKLQQNDRVVIVTNDRDYASVFNNKSVLNAKLHSDISDRQVEYFVYSEILDGIKKLRELQQADAAAFEAKDFPTEAEQTTIQKEEQKIIVDSTKDTCQHGNWRILPNGVFDDYTCMDCGRVLYRVYSDDND